MPRAVSGLWDEVISWDNLVGAYFDARRSKRFKTDVMRFHRQWEENLLNIHNHLVWGSWEPKPFKVFFVHEPKERVIEAPAFSDRIVHHAMHRVLSPYFERRFIRHSYACRPGKGTHWATYAVQKMLRKAKRRWGRAYVLQADISKYFPSIDHDVFMRQAARTIGDRRVLGLWEQIVRDRGVQGVGLPVGALTSQLAANVYLDPLDHHVADDLGHGLYARYMDDWVVMGPSKPALRDVLDHLRGWLWDKLRLKLSRYHIYPASKGVDFAGYRTWATHRLPRKSNAKRARRRIKRLARLCARGQDKEEALRAVKASFYGYTKFCSASTVWNEIERDLADIYSPASSF